MVDLLSSFCDGSVISSRAPPVGVTAIAGLTVVGVPRFFLVFFIHPGLVVIVAVYARELTEVAGLMAFCAVKPMLAAIDGKVVIEDGLCPAHVVRQVT